MRKHPQSTPLRNIRACVFDAYGTLFDYTSAAMRCRDLLGGNFERLNALWREKQLQYTWLRSLEGSYVDFWQLTGDALDFALDTLQIDDRALRGRLMDLYLTLEPFPEVPDVLARLKSAGFKIAILSNGSPAMLEAVAASAGIRSLLDEIFSADAARVYKPHPSVYQLAVAGLGIEPDAIAFQSANAWDAHGASAFGMRVVWCNRYGQRPERLPGKPDREISSLADLPALVAG